MPVAVAFWQLEKRKDTNANVKTCIKSTLDSKRFKYVFHCEISMTEYRNDIVNYNKLENSDYTAVRDTPSRKLHNFRMLKFAFSISLDIIRSGQPIPHMYSQENARTLQI